MIIFPYDFGYRSKIPTFTFLTDVRCVMWDKKRTTEKAYISYP
jgi:hypothetical protein